MKFVKYILIFITITSIGMLYDRYKKKFMPDEELDKYDLVKKYLLTDSEGIMGKPILWIHTSHSINSRKWPSFFSRNTKQLNQPYKNMCVESIVKHCGKSFNIVLIDDESFTKILPDWSIQINKLSDPIKSHVRELVLCKLLYKYGGILVPNSMIVLKDLHSLYKVKLEEKDCFAGEFVNKGISQTYIQFFPNSKLMGCRKGSKGMKELINNLEINISNDNTDQPKFEGSTDKLIYKLISEGKCGLICGKALGTKNKENKIITIDNLLNEAPLKLCLSSLYCIYIYDEDILNRTKYQWFSRLNRRQILESNTQVAKYFLLSHGKLSL